MNVTSRHLHALQMPFVPTLRDHSSAHAERDIRETEEQDAPVKFSIFMKKFICTYFLSQWRH